MTPPLRRLLPHLAAIAALAALLAPRRAGAQVTETPLPLFPDPARFASGLFVEGRGGAAIALGKQAGHISAGPAMGVAVGYDITRWLAVQVIATGSTHRGVFAGAPADGELVQMLRVGGEVKLTKTFRQLSLFAYGGAGWLGQSSNLFVVTGVAKRDSGLAAGGGLGVDWHTLSRHFSLGLAPGFTMITAMSGTGLLGTTAYLRYTF